VKEAGAIAESLARQLLQRSAAAYRAAPGLRGHATVEFPTSVSAEEPVTEARPDTNTIEYVLGRGADASFSIDGYGGTALGGRAYLTRSDRPGVYVAVELLRDLPTTMKSVFGSAMFVPPQLVMRAGHNVEAIVDAMGLGLITGLVPVGFQARNDKAGRPIEEIEFRGDQGSVVACFSADSAFLLSIEASIGDAGFSYVFHDENIIPPDGAVRFDAGDRKEVAGPVGPAVVGAPAPDFTLDALDGSTRSLASARGGRLVIDFWALWCGPCVSAMPGLDALAKRLVAAAEPVALWTVAIVESRDEAGILKRIRDMWADKGLTLPVLIDRDGLVSQGYGVKALPTTVVVDQRGIVELIEPALDPGKLEKLISRS
jgi:cytochrome c biogenesis protein CcmG, thiol:disulfide interchange protein DsbE